MAAPPLTIAVQPTENAKVLYLPIAAMHAQAKPQIKIVVRLKLTNKGASPLTLKGIDFEFPGSTVLKKTMQGVKIAVSPVSPDTDPNNGLILAGETATWSNGVVDLDTSENGENTIRNEVYLDAPLPTKVKIVVRCENFSDPVTTTMDLAPFLDPTGKGAFILPFAASDLAKGEYIVTKGKHWANGGPSGVQIYAHDILVEALDAGSWTDVKSGGNKASNEGYRIFGLPVRAMADGIVLDWNSDTLENEAPGKMPKPTPEGNHFWIQHGDVKVKYTHLKHGSLEPTLMVVGVAVKAGQRLARAGNNGRSTKPHLHIESVHISTNSLRGFPFKNGWVLERTKIAADQGGPWVKLTADGICAESVAIWPSSLLPRTLFDVAGIEGSGDWGLSLFTSSDLASFRAEAQTLFDEKGRRLIQCATFLERGQRRWIGLSRDGDWANTFWVSTTLSAFKTEVQKLFEEKGRRLVHVHTFPQGDGRRWVGIARGSASWSHSFWVSNDFASFDAEVKKLWIDKGRALVQVGSFREGNARRWFGIARGHNQPSIFWVSNSQTAFRTQVQKLSENNGHHLEHVHTFIDGGLRRWVGISRPGTSSNQLWVSPDLDAFRRRVQDGFDEHQQRLFCLEILDNEA